MRWSSKWWVGERAWEREGKLVMRCHKSLQIPVWQTMIGNGTTEGGWSQNCPFPGFMITGKMGLRHDVILAIFEWIQLYFQYRLILVSTISIHFECPNHISGISQGATKWARHGQRPVRLWVSSRIISVNLINAALDYCRLVNHCHLGQTSSIDFSPVLGTFPI